MKKRPSLKKRSASKLKILAVSDWEDAALIRQVETKTLEPVDLVVSCGDLPPEYLSFLRDRLDTPLLYVKGNHDLRYTAANPAGCRNIHARVVTVNRMNILGLEGSMWYNGGVNQYTETMMKRTISKLRFIIMRKGRIHMMVTHAPPRHIHDREDPCHMGFECFNALILKRRPRVFIHGHVHQTFDTMEDRITRVNGTRVINTCGFTIMEVEP